MTQTATPARENKSQLARRLKIHRHQLDALLARPGAPSPDRRKTYAVEAVAGFVSAQKADGSLDTLRAARLKEIQLRCEGLRRQLGRDAKEVITVAELNILLKHIGMKLKLAIYTGLENDLPPKLDGLPAVEARRILREWGDSVVDQMRECLVDCPAKTGFPETVKVEV